MKVVIIRVVTCPSFMKLFNAFTFEASYCHSSLVAKLDQPDGFFGSACCELQRLASGNHKTQQIYHGYHGLKQLLWGKITRNTRNHGVAFSAHQFGAVFLCPNKLTNEQAVSVVDDAMCKAKQRFLSPHKLFPRCPQRCQQHRASGF